VLGHCVPVPMANINLYARACNVPGFSKLQGGRAGTANAVPLLGIFLLRSSHFQTQLKEVSVETSSLR
jgi:hypothetical protein